MSPTRATFACTHSPKKINNKNLFRHTNLNDFSFSHRVETVAVDWIQFHNEFVNRVRFHILLLFIFLILNELLEFVGFVLFKIQAENTI